jgi:hypothetical protein
MRSKQRTVALLGALVVLALAVSASAANAAIQYEWKVKGAALKAGASKELTLKSKGLFHISLRAFGQTFEFTAGKLRLQAGVESNITGGKPGRLLAENLYLEEAKVTKPKKGCEVKGGDGVRGVIDFKVLGEIVESAEAEKGTGKTMMLLYSTGSFGSIELVEALHVEEKEECPEQGLIFKPEGTILAEISPQKTEAKSGQLVLGTAGTKAGTEYRNSEGKFAVTSVNLSTVFSGEAEMELASKEVFGAF